MDYPTYDPQSPLTPLNPAELDALDLLLQRLPADAAMSLDGADGFLTALLVGPPEVLATLATAQWLPLVWGGDDEQGAEGTAPFASRRQRKTTVVMLLRHLRHISEELEQRPDDWQPIFSIAEQGADEWADARDWCTGFLQAVDLMPGAWGDAFADAALAPLLQLGGGLEGFALEEEVDLDDAALCDGLSRVVPEAVLHLRTRYHPDAGAASS